MTDVTLEWEDKIEILPIVIKIISILLMSAAFIGALALLDWAVTDKISKEEVYEASKITAASRERQLACLATNIYREAGGEPFEGKVGVAQVTINRTESGLFSSDICEVVYQKDKIYEKVLCQFSWVCQKSPIIAPTNEAAYKESMEVAKKVLLEGFRLSILNQALYFHGDYINPGWKRQKIGKIGHHIFYK